MSENEKCLKIQELGKETIADKNCLDFVNHLPDGEKLLITEKTNQIINSNKDLNDLIREFNIEQLNNKLYQILDLLPNFDQKNKDNIKKHYSEFVNKLFLEINDKDISNVDILQEVLFIDLNQELDQFKIQLSKTQNKNNFGNIEDIRNNIFYKSIDNKSYIILKAFFREDKDYHELVTSLDKI